MTSGAERPATDDVGEVVSRETPSPADGIEPLPIEAVDLLFGGRRALAERFMRHLVTSGVERGLLGPRETGRIWTRHVLNCAVIGELVPAEASVLDIGSGAGLPGIALAIARPDLSITLVEPLERRTIWLQEVVEDLGIGVRVVRARAEELPGRERAQVVMARAVAALPKLAGWGLPLVQDGGTLLAIKGRSAQDELAAAAPGLRRAGARQMDVVECGVGVLGTPTTVVRVVVGPDRAVRGSGRRSR